MRGVRIALKGLSDTLEHLLPFALASLAWWVGVFTVVFAPGATLALFRLADPRTLSDLDRPTVRESARQARGEAKRGWRLAVVCLPILAILVRNLWFYGLGGKRFSWLAPFWIALLLLALMVTVAAFSRAALFTESPRAALRGGSLLVARILPTALIVTVLLWLFFLLCAVLVVPVFMFLPATIAATANRLVLWAANVPVADPLSPTVERLAEEERAKDRRRFGP